MPNKKMFLSGQIVRGLGEGTYFMSIKKYREKMRLRLGFDAYPGTLNLMVGKTQAVILSKITPTRINGFRAGNSTFGGVNCYKARIQNINGSIIVPDLTKHEKNIIEFIAPVHIKSELKLKDGDLINLELLRWRK